VNPAFQKALSCGAINRAYGKSKMEKRSKLMLLAVILLILGAVIVVDAYVQNISVDYLIGLALAILGSIFWICAE
jgi:drug/metabolite transporter (DMT)-like permease